MGRQAATKGQQVLSLYALPWGCSTHFEQIQGMTLTIMLL